MTRIVIIAALALVAPLTLLVHGKAAGTPVYGYTVVNSFPHDPQAFTQGLILRDGVLYESTGLNGQSSLRKVRLETGEVLQRITVDGRYFAEGLRRFRDEPSEDSTGRSVRCSRRARRHERSAPA